MKPKKKLLVFTSTFPRWKDDTNPPFVYELSRRLTDSFEVYVLASGGFLISRGNTKSLPEAGASCRRWKRTGKPETFLEFDWENTTAKYIEILDRAAGTWETGASTRE